MEYFTLVGNVKGFKQSKGSLIFDCNNSMLELKVLDANIVRVRLSPAGSSFPQKSYAVIWDGEGEFSVSDEGEFVHVDTGEVVVRVFKNPCRIVFEDRKGKVINEDYWPAGMGWKPSKWEGYHVKCWKKLFMDERFYGFGEKAGTLDKRREKLVMWNTDAWGYKSGSDPLYLSVPFFIGLRKNIAYGIFFDNTFKAIFDMGHTSEEFYSFEAEGGILDYYFIYGPRVKDVVEGYTRLTGRMPLPPLWSLGHQQSRYSYYPEEHVVQIAERYRLEHIPCDVIYLDIHYMEDFKVFTWNKRRFPDPYRLKKKLSAMGFKLVVIVDPGVKLDPQYHVFREGVLRDFFCKTPRGDLYVGKVWPGLCVFPDYTRDDVRKWWGDLHKTLTDVGVDGIWNDMNEPSIFTDFKTMDLNVLHKDGFHAKIHNVYALLECKATYEGLLRLRPNKRPFILTRSGFAGIQRYAAKWTGDNASTWEHLWLQIPMVLNLGLSGIPFTGADIGGFAGRPSPELLVRWYQVAVFMPLCRNHQMMGTYDHEPWMYGKRTKTIIREMLKLRYSLLPYIYSLFYEHYLKGYPPVRPLFFEFQDDEETYSIDDEFMLGEALLVAPILREGARGREVYLPSTSLWYDFWSGEMLEETGWTYAEAPLDRIPLYVKAGAVIPMWPPMNYVGEKDPNPLFIHYYPSTGKNTFILYEDDGVTLNYRRGECRETLLSAETDGKAITIKSKVTKGTYKPPRDTVVIVIHGLKDVNIIEVEKDGRMLKQVKSLKEPGEGYCYNTEKGELYVKLKDKIGVFSLSINFT